MELARQTHDRVSLLETDHSRLAKATDSRFASSSEFDDWVLNRSEEDWIEISGKGIILPYHAMYVLSIRRHRTSFVIGI